VIAGRYSLEREIGRGGQGAVWLGVDEVLGREVALKRLGLAPGADSTDLERAEREARLTARLDHDHVVSVFNFVVDPDTDIRWLVMEYVEGSSLGELVRREGPLAPDAAAPLLWQAADALVAAHSAGIVHRDVKPSNILVDRHRRVKLTDFGIARIAADPSLTQTGLITGSPAYLPPEVAAGSRGEASADVWSLGATLFHVLSGRPPYDVRGNVMGALFRIVNDEPPRLATAGWMTPLLEGTMVKDPQRRWSMAEVRDFLADPAERPPLLPRSYAAATPVKPAAPVTARFEAPPAPTPRGRRTATGGQLVVAGVALAVVLAGVLFAVLRDRGPARSDDPAAGSTHTRSSSPSGSPTPSPVAGVARPTARGMEAFIDRYVAAVGSDPDRAWNMLTAKFQAESGGLAHYRQFWSGVGNGQVLDISADPETLVVSYHVRFEHFGTGRNPTVLDLVFRHGRYLIDGEHSRNFVPQG
jgi:hypothetical protein